MELLTFLLETPIKNKLECIVDNKTWYPIPARRCYGGYVVPVKEEVTICDSLCINNGDKEYEEMVDDMTQMSLLRSKGLLKEKRMSRYEKAKKALGQ
jgi:hypothetical protein